MRIVDCTRPFDNEPLYRIERNTVPLVSEAVKYTGVVYHLALNSMVSTYIDFPGHIKETDDGRRANNTALADLFRRPADIIHLNRESGSGAVTGQELADAFGNRTFTGDILILNALGHKNVHDIELRTVWLDDSAVQWVIDSGCRYFVSDVYESLRLEGVFQRLFGAGIATICEPWNLYELPDTALMTIMYLPAPNVSQMPCNMLAEIE